MELSCAVRVLPFEVACDTILLTTSSVFEVRHFNSDNPGDLAGIVSTYGEKYKIVLISDSYDAAKETLKAMRTAQASSSVSVKDEDHCQNSQVLSVFNENMTRLMGKMIEKSQKKSTLYHLKKTLEETETKIKALKEKQFQQSLRESLQPKETIEASGNKKKAKERKVIEKQLEHFKLRKIELQAELEQLQQLAPTHKMGSPQEQQS